MKFKLLIIFTILIFCGQIGFSIYYSIKIVDENTKINFFQENLSNQKYQNQILENQLSHLNSLKNIEILSTSTASLSPINTYIDLR